MQAHSPIHELPRHEWPPLLSEMSDQPKKLFVRGTLPDPAVYRYLCVVGSRKHSPYGTAVCERLIAGLAGHAVAIVSGLALGLDAVAHRAALDAGLPTVAFPGSGLDDEHIYPPTHLSLARRILESGGALVGEYKHGGLPGLWNFPRRNRLMAGISLGTLIIEAGAQSGTLITARLALEYNRTVMVVPGELFSPHALGSNALLRQGAQVVTSSQDILESLGIPTSAEPTPELFSTSLSEAEKRILTALRTPLPLDELVRTTQLPPNDVRVIVSTMEIKGMLVHSMGVVRRAY